MIPQHLPGPLRILLLGELSGVHRELAPGLRALGHEVVTGHSRLAFPGYESDIPFYRPPAEGGTPWTLARDVASQLLHAPKLTGFDVVQVMTTKFFNWKLHAPMMRFLKRNNRRLVVINTACTSDYFLQFKKLNYRPCEHCLSFDQKSERCRYDREDERTSEYVAFELADAIVATHFEYVWALQETPFAAKVVGIPLPVDTRKHRPAPMPDTERVRVWYGETRHGFKGGAYILPALQELEQSNWVDQVEVVRTGRLDYEDYLAFLRTVHIVIDQASSYGPAMNAIYALAAGRVTLSGAEQETLDFVGVSETDNPVINIRPDVQQIRSVLEGLLRNRDTLAELGRRSAEYVARYHDSRVVAARYVALYEELLQRAAPRQPLPA